ncbi:MAG: NUDIX domain-containing protein, partial [Dehalococcoidia bacterium]
MHTLGEGGTLLERGEQVAAAPRLKVGVVVFQRSADGRLRYLLLQRPRKVGGGWGVVTGSVDPWESVRQAAEREAREETGIEDFVAVIDLEYTHAFQQRGHTYQEPYFAIQVPPHSEVRLSYEHVAYRWATLEEALPLLRWPHWADVLRLTEQKAGAT